MTIQREYKAIGRRSRVLIDLVIRIIPHLISRVFHGLYGKKLFPKESKKKKARSCFGAARRDLILRKRRVSPGVINFTAGWLFPRAAKITI